MTRRGSFIFGSGGSSSRDSSIVNGLLPARTSGFGAMRRVTGDNAMRQSATWASLRLRADLISSFPIDTFRKIDGIQVEVPKPPVIVNPSPGHTLTMREWMYSSQIDLDRYGNCFGIIREVDARQKPRRIELVANSDVVVSCNDDVVTYRIKNKTYSADEIWHEKQYTLPGLVVGLSPIAYAAWSLGLWQSAAEFAHEWFGNHGIIPNAHLRNKNKTLTDTEADKAKARYKVAVEGGDIFVTGNDWEFNTVPAALADARFLEAQQYSDLDAVRFFGVPGDMVDVASKGASITYANITQRNLQLLIMNLGGAVARREDALSSILPDPRFVKLNTDAILRMDPKTRSEMLIAEVAGKVTAPSEARALMNRAPFTPEQIAEFEDLGIIHTIASAPPAATPTKGS